ncbi:MAG: hypothetical protein NC084_04165 [Bacteroides sp.]|nr:hypothetical protein [Eubacterium sp.]MCM1417639.1 hypothetical protein [Roseburia sp.]MCM1461896.1 hypothetical protein [Bacteroides sp.]
MCLKLATFLEDHTNVPLRDWDLEILETFHQMYYPHTTLDYAYDTLPMVLKSAGSNLDTQEMKSLMKPKYKRRNEVEVAKAGEGKEGATEYFLSWGDLDATMSQALLRCYPEENPVTYISKHSSAKAVYCLGWLGFTVSDIDRLERSAYDPQNKRFLFDGKEYSFSSFPTMARFFDAYQNADGFLRMNATSEYFQTFSDTPWFIRKARPTGGFQATRYTKKAADLFGFPFLDVLWSGRLNRLYGYESASGELSLANLEEAANDLKIDLGDRYQGTKYQRLMMIYQRYKQMKQLNGG